MQRPPSRRTTFVIPQATSYGRMVQNGVLVCELFAKTAKPDISKRKTFCKCVETKCTIGCKCKNAGVACVVGCLCTGNPEKCHRQLTIIDEKIECLFCVLTLYTPL